MDDPRWSIIDTRLAPIKRIIAVSSGKGGVGKSLVAVGLALHLSRKGYSVGLLDLDFYGPSDHIILGVHDVVPQEDKGLVPPVIHGIRFMSLVFFTQDKAVSFRGGDLTNIVVELLAITRWGPLDYLLVDMPPGLGDETLDVIRYIKKGEFLVVTTPSKVARGVVGKLLTLLRELRIPLLGVVENMKMTDSSLVKNHVTAQGIPYLGGIGFDDHVEEALGDRDRLFDTRFMQQLDAVSESIRFGDRKQGKKQKVNRTTIS